MPCRPVGLIWLIAAAAGCAAFGAAATAEPGGAPRELAPAAELAPNGAAEAPPVLGPDGAAEAPLPIPPEVAEAPDAKVALPDAAPAPLPEPEAEIAPPAVEPDAAAPVDGATEAVPEAIDGPAPPTSEQALEAEGDALVPVAVLTSPVAAAEDTEPLIDIAPKELDAPALADVSQTDDDEVVIEVPTEDTDEGADQQRGPQPAPNPVVPGAGQLPLTGRALLPALAAALMLIGLGWALRISATPTSSSRARA
jgi:hypothetical protein